MLDKSWEEKSLQVLATEILPELVYQKGALDFQVCAIKAIEKHALKADAHDEFETESTKTYLRALKNVVEIIKAVKANENLEER